MIESHKPEDLSVFLEGHVIPLADEDFQRKVWIDGSWEKWATLDEVYMGFCDFCEPILASPKSYRLNNEQLYEIQKLYNLMEEFDEKNAHVMTEEEYKAVLANPLWKGIQLQAKKVLMVFGEDDLYRT